MDKKAQILNDWESFERANRMGMNMPIICGEGNGCVYRLDAFATDWRDNPNNLPNRVKAPYNSFVWNRSFSEYYPTPQSFWNPRDTRAYKYMKDKEAFDNVGRKFRDSEQTKYLRVLESADKRPLHRKDSLNRAFE